MKLRTKILMGLITAAMAVGVGAVTVVGASETKACEVLPEEYLSEITYQEGYDDDYEYWDDDDDDYYEDDYYYEPEYYDYSAYYEPVETYYQEPTYSSGDYSAYDLMTQGRIYWGGYEWTWYSQNVLPGGGLDIPGRYVDGDGYVCDGNGNICLASSELSYGTVVSTPFGKDGCVYDSGCAYGVLDVYTAW